jgi:hypothetical protein
MRSSWLLVAACGGPTTTVPVVTPAPVVIVTDAAVPDAPLDAPPDAALVSHPDAFDINAETIGPLHLGMSDAEAVKLLGRTKAKPPKPDLMGATGEYVSFWDFGQALLQMSSPKVKGPFRVTSIEITKPSKFVTSRGIGIGASKADVLAAYGPYLGQTEEPNAILVGSPYGGMLLTLRSDRVASIFLGAMAF